ncbi:unnamed protein product [Prorocentrum cordatum]|uniref:Uncharacterized protein n=1 Tax=Prorocentrum cordatum TaxID=2364126 RepID=A0ABN9PWB8_9DINO|nr:unnamed protein product [Polarella glacialis]
MAAKALAALGSARREAAAAASEGSAEKLSRFPQAVQHAAVKQTGCVDRIVQVAIGHSALPFPGAQSFSTTRHMIVIVVRSASWCPHLVPTRSWLNHCVCV